MANNIFVKASIILAIVCNVICINTINAQGPNTWTQKANIGGTGRNGAFSFGNDVNGYIGGGFTNNDLWEYSIATNTWSQKASYPGAETIWCSNFSIGNKGYVGMGGYTSSYASDFWEYDMTANTWTAKATFAGGARGRVANFVINGKGYVCTGSNTYSTTTGNTTDLWEYDPSTNAWTQKTSFPGTARQLASGFAIGNKGYVGVGTEYDGGTVYSDFYSYDPSANVWSAITSYPTTLYAASSFSIGNKGYVCTGLTSPVLAAKTQAMYGYDPVANTWTSKANFPGVARNSAVGFTIGLRAYLGTGFATSSSYEVDFYQYTSDALITGHAPAALCIGESFTIEYDCADPYFLSGNVFTAQLSDASGSFASPVTIGTTTATTAGNIAVTIPAGTVAGGGYRIRVVGSNPSVIGEDNGIDITVKPTPTVNTVANQLLCNGDATAAIIFGGTVAGTTYNWTNNTPSMGLAASGSGDIASFTATNTATANVTGTITVTPTAAGCPGPAITPTITIKPTPTMNAVASQSVCNGATTTKVILSGSTLAGTSYNWTNNTTSIGLAASGTGNISAFTATNPTTANVIATISITPTAAGCPGATITPTITVKPTPTVNTVADQLLCNGDATTAIIFGGTVAGTTYNWTNNAPSIGLAASGSGDIASFTATNTTTANVTGTITVTPIAAGCPGTDIAPTITVKPTPTMNAVADQSVCNGATTTKMILSGPVTGASYNWTNNTTSIGLAASGTGNISAFTATNTTTANVIATITVTPTAAGCTGATITPTITVKPTPTVNAVTNQLLCNGDATTAIIFSGTVAGTTYNWTNNAASIGLAASGSGDIASFTATNTTSANVTGTITVTPMAAGCPGTDIAPTITVKPTPDVATVSNQSFCNAASTPAINFTGAVTGTTFNWTNSNTAIGLAASGTGNIASFTAINTGTTAVTATITVTPTASGCPGPAKTFTITIQPTPTVNTVTGQILCNGEPTTAINFSGAVTGTTYGWTNNAASIGLAASGSGNIASFTATNTTASPVTATITVTPTINTCPGAAKTFTILVNPTPKVNTIPDMGICNGNASGDIIFSSATSGTTYTWTNSNTAIGLGASGTGNILSFTGTNSGTTPISSTVSVTPTANGCIGPVKTFVITINPIIVPTISISSSAPLNTICVHTKVTFTATTTNEGTNPTYQWRKNGVAVGTNSSIYIDYNLADGDIVTCDLISSITCPSSAVITSSSIVTHVNMYVYHTIEIFSDKQGDTLCAGEVVNFTSVITNGGSAPIYKWMKNGSGVGANTPTYSDANIMDRDNIICSLTTNILCPAASTITSSNRVVMHSMAKVNASTVIVGVFTGVEYIFQSQVTNCGNNPSYQWMLNNAPIGGATNDSLHIKGLKETDKIRLVVTPDRRCTNNAIANSNILSGSQVTAVENIDVVDRLTLSPNPNNGSFMIEGHISALHQTKDADLIVTNALGQVVYRSKVDVKNNEIKTNLQLKSVLVSGTYHLTITAEGQKYNARFIVVSE